MWSPDASAQENGILNALDAANEMFEKRVRLSKQKIDQQITSAQIVIFPD